MSASDSNTDNNFQPWAPRRKQRADLKRGRVLCPAKSKPSKRADGKVAFKNIERWIMDTGSGLDLVAYSDIVHVAKHMEEAKLPVNFNTANGGTRGDQVLRASMPSLKEEIQPYVLENTPAVLSVGLRCKQYGYAFHWFGYKEPFLVTPEQKIFELEVTKLRYSDSQIFLQSVQIWEPSITTRHLQI